MIATTFDFLAGRYGGRLMIPLAEAAGELGVAPRTALNMAYMGTLPVPTIQTAVGARRMVSLRALADYLDGIGAGVPSAEPPPAADIEAPRRRGRPTKAEQAARRAARTAGGGS